MEEEEEEEKGYESSSSSASFHEDMGDRFTGRCWPFSGVIPDGFYETFGEGEKHRSLEQSLSHIDQTWNDLGFFQIPLSYTSGFASYLIYVHEPLYNIDKNIFFLYGNLERNDFVFLSIQRKSKDFGLYLDVYPCLFSHLRHEEDRWKSLDKSISWEEKRELQEMSWNYIDAMINWADNSALSENERMLKKALYQKISENGLEDSLMRLSILLPASYSTTIYKAVILNEYAGPLEDEYSLLELFMNRI